MQTKDAEQFEGLLTDLLDADHELRKAILVRRRAHTAVLSFVAQRVPAGTSDDGMLDIPEFLRKHND